MTDFRATALRIASGPKELARCSHRSISSYTSEGDFRGSKFSDSTGSTVLGVYCLALGEFGAFPLLSKTYGSQSSVHLARLSLSSDNFLFGEAIVAEKSISAASRLAMLSRKHNIQNRARKLEEPCA